MTRLEAIFAGGSTAICLLAGTAEAEIIASAPDHYELRHEASSALAPTALWARLIDPASWWHPEHTYSGDSANLSLELEAGGLWREDWEGGSVTHGTVLYVDPGRTLRLDAPFGPLQEQAVTTIWTISIAPDGEGSRVTFTELASGSVRSGLDELAPAVDYVKAEAMARLVAVD